MELSGILVLPGSSLEEVPAFREPGAGPLPWGKGKNRDAGGRLAHDIGRRPPKSARSDRLDASGTSWHASEPATADVSASSARMFAATVIGKTARTRLVVTWCTAL